MPGLDPISIIASIAIGKAEQALRAAFTRQASPAPALPADEREALVVATARTVLADPRLVNALDREPALQSRVVVGSSMGLVAAAGILAAQYGAHGLDPALWQWEVAGPAVGAVWGSGLALYGRLRSGLAPLFGWLG